MGLQVATLGQGLEVTCNVGQNSRFICKKNEVPLKLMKQFTIMQYTLCVGTPARCTHDVDSASHRPYVSSWCLQEWLIQSLVRVYNRRDTASLRSLDDGIHVINDHSDRQICMFGSSMGVIKRESPHCRMRFSIIRNLPAVQQNHFNKIFSWN